MYRKIQDKIFFNGRDVGKEDHPKKDLFFKRSHKGKD